MIRVNQPGNWPRLDIPWAKLLLFLYLHLRYYFKYRIHLLLVFIGFTIRIPLKTRAFTNSSHSLTENRSKLGKRFHFPSPRVTLMGFIVLVGLLEPDKFQLTAEF